MINAKRFKKLTYINDGKEVTVTDVVVIPTWLLRKILRYEEPLLKERYNSLNDYGKGIVDTLKGQHETMSVNQ